MIALYCVPGANSDLKIEALQRVTFTQLYSHFS